MGKKGKIVNKYRWKHLAPGKVTPDAAANEITRIISIYGCATPNRIVFEARRKRNPLHDCFEWNDTIAAKMYRESQARYILRSIETVIDQSDDEPIRIRAFPSVIENDKNVYITLAHAREVPELWEQVVEKALLEIKNWRETYKHIKEFEAIFIAIDKVA